MSNRGITLLEMLVVLAIVGILVLTVPPRIASLRDRALVASSSNAMAIGFRQARATAFARQVATELRVDPTRLQVVALEGTTPVVVWNQPGPAASGVVLTAPSTIIRLAPSGLPVGVINGTWQFARNLIRRDVVVSRYGRVRIVPR